MTYALRDSPAFDGSRWLESFEAAALHYGPWLATAGDGWRWTGGGTSGAAGSGGGTSGAAGSGGRGTESETTRWPGLGQSPIDSRRQPTGIPA